MSEETCNDLINFIYETVNKNGTKYISIEWYGGEPLLEIDTIMMLSKKINEICEKNKIQLDQGCVCQVKIDPFSNLILTP